jgi:F-type H+-transporting ATPase subunit delta
LVQEWKKHVPVEVRFASPLTEEQKNKLEEKIRTIAGKIPEITYREDPSLIGGIRVQIVDTVLDGSLSAKISALKGVIKG